MGWADVACRIGGIRAIGLTGGIGSGKSTVSHRCWWPAAPRWSTPTPSPAASPPRRRRHAGAAQPFGDDVADASGALDRARMRSLVFADPDAKAGSKPSCTR
jgi:dephospho-CoA kinase